MTPLRPAALVATLGTQPQVVTIALDLLLRRGERVDEVVVIHTSSLQAGRAHDPMRGCLAALEREFPGRALCAAR